MNKAIAFILILLTFKISYSQKDTIPKAIYSDTIAYTGKVPGVIRSPIINPYTEKDTIPRVIYSDKYELNKPIVVLNNKYVYFETLKTLNPNSIESVDIEKGKFNLNNQEYHGKIIVTTKSGYDLKLLTLNALIEKYTTLKKDANVIFSIDGELLNIDGENLLVDEKGISQIKVVKLDKINCIKDLYAVELITRTPKNLNQESKIMLRGNE